MIPRNLRPTLPPLSLCGSVSLGGPPADPDAPVAEPRPESPSQRLFVPADQVEALRRERDDALRLLAGGCQSCVRIEADLAEACVDLAEIRSLCDSVIVLPDGDPASTWERVEKLRDSYLDSAARCARLESQVQAAHEALDQLGAPRQGTADGQPYDLSLAGRVLAVRDDAPDWRGMVREFLGPLQHCMWVRGTPTTCPGLAQEGKTCAACRARAAFAAEGSVQP